VRYFLSERARIFSTDREIQLVTCSSASQAEFSTQATHTWREDTPYSQHVFFRLLFRFHIAAFRFSAFFHFFADCPRFRADFRPGFHTFIDFPPVSFHTLHAPPQAADFSRFDIAAAYAQAPPH
jgi:hypothetical protein